MTVKQTGRIALALWALGAVQIAAADFRAERLGVVANVTEEHVGGESEYDFAAALDGVWADQWEGARLELTIDSDFDRSLTEQDEYDRLKTWVRYLFRERPADEWNPLIAVSTEGDHDFDQVQTLVAVGLRRHFGDGFVEVTGGASKDLSTGDDWVGDVGALVQFERTWERLTWTLNPEVNYGLLGELRFRENRALYSLSSGLSYRLTGDLGIAYRLELNNTLGDDRRHQFLGISYNFRR